MDNYPDIDDPDFQVLIARRMEFRDLRNIDGLYKHQEFVRRFMSPYTPYKSLILYHSLGSGKSIACIAVAVDHYLYNKKKCIIVTKGDSGTSNFYNQIDMYIKMSASGRRNEWNKSIFTMKHYISLSNQISNMSDNEIKKEFSNNIIILDEVHNVRYLKKVKENSVYGSIIRLLRLCTEVKIIIATATPMTDNHEQIGSLLGICNYHRKHPYSMKGIISYNSVIEDKPKSIGVGTDDYVPGVRVYASDMKGHQRYVYAMEDTDKPPDDIYRKLTHLSLFCFKDGTHGREITRSKLDNIKMLKTITSMSTKQTKELRYVKYCIKPEWKSSLTGDELQNSSCKYSAVIDLLSHSDGNVFIFLEEVKGSGLLLLANILEQHGYELYLGNDTKSINPGKRYTMCVGSSEICPNNADRIEGFNSDDNKKGDYVRILLGSRVIGESITLKNVRHFYCLTPHWNDSTVDQAIGRVVRNRSHASLIENDRNVNIYIHVSVFPDKPQNSVDIKKLVKCKEKEISIHKVTQMMIDDAVDKFCLTGDLMVTHFDTFAAAYVHNVQKTIASQISYFVVLARAEGHFANIYHISDHINVHPTICKEVVCRMIMSNTVIKLPQPGFIRAYGDIVFIVDDPSTPYVIVPRTDIDSANIDKSVVSVPKQSLNLQKSSAQSFRYMQAKDKAAFLEHCITNDKLDMIEQLSTTYADIDGTIYHLLLYRDLESSYTSSNPVPKKPMGKTRAFDKITKSWYTINSPHEERKIFDAYKELVDKVLDDADTLGVYGIISTIDGEMRLRLRGAEDNTKSSMDKRYVRRGKNIRSIRKDDLIDILLYLTEAPKQDLHRLRADYHMSLSISEMVKLVDGIVVNKGLYVIL